ncbi:glycosyltransferase [Priestia megaterium]|uniref:glycosyltransferase n=1 Tax=Priestia megaterium TaxID=1404 RepID=UPI001CD69AFC|nr:glycosyltransferase family 2 protein [Priestia megaterium]
MKLLSVSIIIPVYNAERTLGSLLKSLLSQSYPQHLYDIILINDNSEDKSALIMDEYKKKSKNVKVMNNNENFGRSKTRNKGINNSQNDLLIFLDSDCIPKESKFIEAHVSLHNTNNKIGIGAVSFPDISENPFDQFRDSRENIRRRHFSSKPLNFFHLATANMSILRENLLRLRGFDEDFIHWGAEDIELGYRAVNQKLEIFLIKETGDVTHYDERVNLEKYCERIYSFSKFNIPILMNKHPDIVNHFKNYRKLERINYKKFPDVLSKIPIQLFVVVSHKFLHQFFKKNIVTLNKISPILYKVYISKYYMNGVRDRKV